MKIIDKINAMEEGKPFYSYEYFPPKTDAGVSNLFARIDRMAQTEPLFVDCTWGAGGSTSDLTMEICKTVQQYMGVDIMMHLTCTNMPAKSIYDALTEAKAAGIHNILALRGDPPHGKEWTKVEDGFGNAVDLVSFIRKEHGDYFGIGVAGYPEGHMQAESYEADLQFTKEKVDAGADFIVTQLFYDMASWFKYLEDCKRIGINCPIIPGMMPIQTYKGFYRMVGFCDTKVPDSLRESLELYKDDDAACKDFGVKLCTDMCNQMKAAGTKGFHFYTLNLEKSALQIVKKLGLYKPEVAVRALPWRPSTGSSDRTEKEAVRPIFWANRPKSYLSRTSSWDEFPNGRWGDSQSAAFGDLKDYYLSRLQTGVTAEKKVAMWGTPTAEADIRNSFVAYCKGEIARLPWSEAPMALESGDINATLVALNQAGVLTINSQPQVNGLPSSDPAYGWGGEGGYVYQKGYVEFFASAEDTAKIVATCEGLSSVSFQALNKKGESIGSCATAGGVNAVTWGVFPGREVIQPTVVDHDAFQVWKDEAFAVWAEEWASAYEPESEAAKVIAGVADSYYLVTIVENDYVGGDVFRAFAGILGGAAAGGAADETTNIKHKDGSSIVVATSAAGTTTTVTHSDGTTLSVSTTD